MNSVLFRLLATVVTLLCSGLGLRADPTADGLYAGFKTSGGTFWCRLEFERVPRTVANFVGLTEGTRDWIDNTSAKIVRRPFYQGVIFHRVIKSFMIQSGSPNGLGTDGPGYQFADEFNANLKHSKPGILSMANSGKNSNGSQFFVTVTNTSWLDGVHTVFGEVVEGMDLVHAISKVPTTTSDRPVTPIVINEIQILRRGTAAQAFQPATVTPALPDVGVVPTAIQLSATQLALLVQSRTNHYLQVYFSGDLNTWTWQTVRSAPKTLTANGLIGRPQVFFRILDGGIEP
ncbi:MAG: peptidylprolyl isomerase [Verrucomicrobiales bacterium]|nr:peptidylprolyl isomerase [Verrucomicrobiales bacterium]